VSGETLPSYLKMASISLLAFFYYQFLSSFTIESSCYSASSAN